MTTLFLVILLEQWMKEKKHYTALIGLSSSIGSLLLFGKENFILPAMGLMLLIMTLYRKPLEKKGGF